LTNPAAVGLIRLLVELAVRTRPTNPARAEVALNETTVTCYGL
jgi:hypothetical protein